VAIIPVSMVLAGILQVSAFSPQRKKMIYSPQRHREHREYFLYCSLEPDDSECENDYRSGFSRPCKK
jgi:hypothetical protein